MICRSRYSRQYPMTYQQITKSLRALANPAIAEHSQRFFKTGPGEYGEGDKFLGIRVPVLRQQVKLFKDAPVNAAKQLLQSSYHEERLFALLLLVEKFKKGQPAGQQAIYDLYLRQTKFINNWDLVDSSAHLIVGPYLQDRSRRPLYKLSKSRSLWERRIAIMSTFCYIKQKDFDDALAISEILLHDEEDLIHKAVGWMLREVGNRDVTVEKAFLRQHYKAMPRTMLRYAIEKFSQRDRKRYLDGKA